MSKTDLKRLRNMHDEDIDYSVILPSTDEELAAMRPLREVFPDLVQRQKRKARISKPVLFRVRGKVLAE